MRHLLFLLALTVIGFASCDSEIEFQTGDAVEISTSVDTLTFDTVFTARGSATRLFKVYNRSDQPIMIDRIFVEGRTGVNFTFNVDGFQGPEARDVAIFGNDSIFVFVEAEVDPSESLEASPFIATDLLVFEMGNSKEEVVLLAFGQNANYFPPPIPDRRNNDTFFAFDCLDGNVTLDPELPVVIYGSVVVDDCTLRLLAGTKVYFQGGVEQNVAVIGGSGVFNAGILLTTATGRVEFLGTREEPVELRTVRLESGFLEQAGLYRGLILQAGSRGNLLQHTLINNSIVGITADSLTEVTLEDCRIINSAGPAFAGRQSTLTARNTLFHSNFGNTIQMDQGGSLTLEHVTAAQYGADAVALFARNYSLDADMDPCCGASLRIRVNNSVLVGSLNNQISIDDGFLGQEPAAFDVAIRNSVVKTDDDFLEFRNGLFEDFYTTLCRGCYNLQRDDALFLSIDEDDYRPDSLSVARDLGRFLPALPTDFDGNARDTESPDAGAFEWQPGG